MAILRSGVLTAVFFALCGMYAPAWSFTETFTIADFPDDDSDSGLALEGNIEKQIGPGPFPAVVLLHTCGGYTDRFKEFWPEFLNDLGIVSLAVDSFGPRGFRKCNRRLFNIRGKDREKRDLFFARDAYGALDFLSTQPYVDKDRIAVMGFSFGAFATNYLAGRRLRGADHPKFRAAIGFYGHCFRLNADDEGMPHLVVIGSEEKWLDDDPKRGPGCKRFLGKGKVELHILADTHHAFDNPRYQEMRESLGLKMLYSAKATERSKELVKEFLSRHMQ